jgi:hypothetical protein
MANPATTQALALPRETRPPRNRKSLPYSEVATCVATVEGPKIYHVSGPYLGSPIIFRRAEFDGFLSKLASPMTKSPLFSEAGIKEYLLEMHKAGTYTNKAEVWEEMEPRPSWRAFNEAFKAAKKEDPTFGKLGRPPAKKKPDG